MNQRLVFSAMLGTVYCMLQATAECKNLVIAVNSGPSWSTTATICADSSFWDPAVEGYNARLGTSAFYSAGIGYQPWSVPVTCMISAAARPSYRYCRFQTGQNSLNNIGSKTRIFRLSNNALFFTVFFNKYNPTWGWDLCCNRFISPFFGAGIGVGYNTLSNLHSVLPTQEAIGFKGVTSIVPAYTKASAVAQVEAGLAVACNDTLVVEIGYRFLYGGRFASNNYLNNIPLGATIQTEVPAWTGRLMANELSIGLSVQF